MTTLGSFTITGVPNFLTKLTGQTWNFATANFDQQMGMPQDQSIGVEEELTDVGVDNKRFRLVHKQFPPFVLHTSSDAATYAAAMALQQNYNLTKNAVGTLTVNLSGVAYRWQKVKVKDVVVHLQAGTLVGNGASSPSLGVIYADWTMILTDGTKPGWQ